MASMVFTSSLLIAQSSFVKRLRTNSKYSSSSWVPKSSIKVSSRVQQLSYKNISVESSKSSFIQGDGFSAFSLPKSSRVLPISKSPSLNATLPTVPGGQDDEDDDEKSIYRLKAKKNGIDKSFHEYKGKILLIVNIPEQSSKWTNSQIRYLNDLYANYEKKGFEIIGFLYDKKETPGDKDIDNSEEITEKAQFPVFDKVELNDKRKKDVWYFLRKLGGEDDVKDPFEMFLVDSRGVPLDRFPPFPPLPVPNPLPFEDQVKKGIEACFPKKD